MAEHNRHVCSICLNDFVKPKIIDCHHTYCLHCLQDYVKKSAKNNKFLCPLCRREIEIPKGGVTKFSANIYIEGACVRKQVQTDIPTCDVCGNVQSHFRCSDCEQYMCHPCKIIHDSLAVSRSHVVFSLDDTAGDKLQRETFCKKHKFAKLEFYCIDCQTGICMKCLMSNHKDHNTPDLKDFTEETRKILDQKREGLEDNLIKLKSELETIQCKVSDERKLLNDSCENVDSDAQRVCATLMKSRDKVKEKMEEINHRNVMRLKNIEQLKSNAISGLEASISHTGNVLKNQSIEEMLKLSSDITSMSQLKEADENFTLPNLQLYTLNAIENETRPISSLAHGSIIYFDSDGITRDQKQCYTKTRLDTICSFIYYYYRLMYYYYLMTFPWVYPFYLLFMCCKIALYMVLWVIFMGKNNGGAFLEDAANAYYQVIQLFDISICDLFSNTEGFEVSFNIDDLKSGMLPSKSPDYERYGCRWHIDVSSDSTVVGLQIFRSNLSCSCRAVNRLFVIRIVDAYGIIRSLTKVDIYGPSLSCYSWPCAYNLKIFPDDEIFKIQFFIFEKNDFIYG